MTRSRAILIFIPMIFLMFTSSQLLQGQVTNKRTGDSFGSIQIAIDNASETDTLEIAAGTYIITEHIAVNKGITIIGADEQTTIIDASGNGTDYGILLSASDINLSKFTIKPPVVTGSLGTSSGGGYAIHVLSTPSSNLHLSNITIENGNRTGLDIQGANDVTLTNITSKNSAYGNGISLTGVVNAELSNITTSDNAWGGIAVYVSSSRNRGSDSITVNTTGSSIGEQNKVYVQDTETLTSTNITINDYDYIIQNENNSVSSLYTWYQDNLDNAVEFSVKIDSTWAGSYITRLSNGQLYVGDGMRIQYAIDAASSGGTINVGAGLYEERIVISKPLTVRGATYTVNKNGYTVPANYEWDESVESIISNPDPALTTSNLVDITNTDDVTFEGFIVQSLNALSGSKNDHLFRIYAHNQGMDNIIVRNNVIGPNTNISSQDGTNGRMGLYLATPSYSDFDITNSTFSGNKIFDCKGNGNNVFIWGGAESYLNGEWSELTGTVIEDNEIYGSHRSGIEIAGGVDDLVIRNNKIYNNSGNPGDDASNLKYGNGIIIIRMGSDKTSPTGYGADNITISNNEIYNNEKNGIYFGPVNSNHTISSNNIHNNGLNGLIIDLEENYHGGVNPVYNRITSITANNNTIENNSGYDIRITGTPSNGFMLDAESNWWGDADPTDQFTGAVDYVPYLDSQGGNDTYPPVHNQTSDEYYMTIQEAVDSADAGDVIKIDEGTFNESIIIDKRLTLTGSLTSGSPVTHLNPSGDKPVIDITGSGQSGNPLVIKNLHLYPDYDPGKGINGIYVGDGVSTAYITIDNVDFTGTNRAYPGLESGIYIDMDASVSNITITNCDFTRLAYGLTVNKGASSNSGFSDVTINNCTFSDNISKGLYFEKLSSAVISSSTFTDNGDTALAASWAKAYCSAVDINLKYGSYSDITLSNVTFINNGLGSTYGSALAVKARGTGNDPSYSSNPAALDDVTVTGCSFQNNRANLRLGEPDKDNTQPTNVSASGNAFISYSDISVENNSTIKQDLSGNWWGNQSPDWTSAVSGDVTYSPWWRNNYKGDNHSSPWGWGADTGLQAAINTVATGDTIVAETGTYDEALTISKKIILSGSGSGESGTIIQSSNPTTVTGGATYPSGYRPVIRLNASGAPGDSLIMKNLRIRPRQDLVGASHPHPAILFEPNTTISYIKLEDVQFIGTSSIGTPEMGIVADGSTGLNHFAISNCEFKDMAYGLIFFNDVDNPTSCNNFRLINSSLERNALKGFYAEKLSDALFNNLIVQNNGDTDRSPSWADANNAGLDINLKNGTYEKITLTGITFSNNGTGSSNGAGLSIKARGTGTDASYSSAPASLSNVNVINCVFENEVNAVNIGEKDKGNTSPSGIILNKNTFANSSIAVNDQRGAAADTIDATGNWWSAAEGPDDGASDGTASYTTSAGQKIFELSDKKIVYAPWYYNNPDDNTSLPGVNQQSPKVFLVEESVPFASKGYINKGIKLASTSYVDTIDIRISSISEVPAVDRKVVLKFSTPPTLDSLDINDGDLELSNDVTISGGVNLNNGNIVTGNNTVIFDTTAVNPVETDSARIIGTVQVQPRKVGKGSLALLGLQIQSGDDDLGKVSFTRKSGNSGVVNVQGNTGIAMTWDIEVDNQPGGSGRTVSFSWPSSFDNGVDPSNIIIYRNTGSGWQYYAGPIAATGNPRQVIINVTGFSSWTVGGSSDPLPVELTDFNAEIIEKGVRLKWVTATEVNNYGFEVERSFSHPDETVSAGTNWDVLGFVPGHGNSNSIKSYEFFDDFSGLPEYPPVDILKYRLKQIDTDGSYSYYNKTVEVSTTITGLEQEKDLPNEFRLFQNYPNPFNPTTTIEYSIPATDDIGLLAGSSPVIVNLIVLNVLGERIATLVNKPQVPGNYQIEFNAGNLSSGVYFYTLTAGEYKQVKKFILAK